MPPSSATPKNPPGALTLRIVQRPGRKLTLTSAELGGCKARLSLDFGTENHLEDVLCEPASRHIAALVRDADCATGEISLIHSTLKLNTLILARARLSYCPCQSDRHITLVFERVFGQLMHLFSKSVDVADALGCQSRVLTDTAIQDICLPLFDFATFLENAHDAEMFGDRARLYRHLNATHHRIRELEQHYRAVAQVARAGSPSAGTKGALAVPAGNRLQ